MRAGKMINVHLRPWIESTKVAFYSPDTDDAGYRAAGVAARREILLSHFCMSAAVSSLLIK